MRQPLRRINQGTPNHLLTYDQRFAPVYDYQVIESVFAVTTFFAIPVGQSTVAHGIRTTRDTNIYAAHTLQEEFMCTGIRVLFVPDCTRHRGGPEDAQDARRVLLGGELRFRIGSRDYVRDAPLAKFPSMMPKTWMGELTYLTPDAEEAHWQMLYDPALPRMAKLGYYTMTPYYIQRNQFFEVQILNEPGPLNAPGKLGVILDGIMMRETARVRC